MKARKEAYVEGIFSDLTLNVLCTIMIAFFLAVLLINPIAKSETVRKEANYIATMTWPADINCDIDMYIRGPDGATVSFTHKSNQYMHIERDDTGHGSDSIVNDKNETVLVTKRNEEVWTLRGVMDGDYVFNDHVYNCRAPAGTTWNSADHAANNIGRPIDIKVHLKIIRVNPAYLIVFEKYHHLKKVWAEETVVKFTISQEGGRFDADPNPEFIPLVSSVKGAGIRNVN